VCVMGAYVCVRLVIGVIKNLPSSEKILDVLYSQRSIGNADDPVVSATYFIQIRELISSVGAGYKSLGIAADAVVSVAQAALCMLARLGAFMGPLAPEKTRRDIQSDINSFLAVVRKVGTSK
jgi:hypothetical protein